LQQQQLHQEELNQIWQNEHHLQQMFSHPAVASRSSTPGIVSSATSLNHSISGSDKIRAHMGSSIGSSSSSSSSSDNSTGRSSSNSNNTYSTSVVAAARRNIIGCATNHTGTATHGHNHVDPNKLVRYH